MGIFDYETECKTIIAGMIALAISHTAMADDIKVAVVGAMSGPIAQWGDMEFNGARQAIKDINAKGGIKGDKLVGVEYDDACDPKQAVAVANKIVNDGIKYVIGHLCSSSTQPASDIYEDEGILMISPGATNPELTQRGYQHIMRTAGLDSSQGPTAAKYILETVKPQRIAIIHDKQQYGEGLARSVQDGLKAANANVVFFDGITAGEKDFSALIARLKKENIDFVYYGGYYPEMGQMLRQARSVGLKTTNPELTQRGYQHIMRTAGLESSQGPTAAKFILETVNPQRIAILHDNQQYGEGLARSVQDGLKAANANVVFFDGITAGEKDFSALIARLKKENIDFVYYGGYYPEMGQMLRQARSVGLKTQFMGPEGVGNASLSNIAGDAAEGMLVTMPKRYDQDPTNQGIVDALKADKKDPSGPYVWITYAAVQSLATALERTGSDEPLALVKDLKANGANTVDKKDPSGPYVWITYAAVQSLATALERTGSDEPLALVKDLKANGANTVIGPLNWDEKGDLKGFDFGVFQWHADGSVSSSGTPTVHPRQPSDHPTARKMRAGLERLPYV